MLHIATVPVTANHSMRYVQKRAAFKGFRFADFASLLEYLSKKCGEGTIVAIDEFQRLSNLDGAISLLQKCWDEKMSKGHCFLILSGSSIRAVQRVALSGDAPLYGRRTATLKLEPLRFLDLFGWFRNFTADLGTNLSHDGGGSEVPSKNPRSSTNSAR